MNNVKISIRHPSKLRHAYLVIAHDNFDILEKQLTILDSENADFYIHVDKKQRNFDPLRFISIPKKSNVTFINRININWGGYSQIQCEINLLKASVPHHYDYYHLISGVDMPIKPKAEIEQFFMQDRAEFYLNFQCDVIYEQDKDRIRYYYIFQDLPVQNRGVKLFLKSLQQAFLSLQKFLRVDRTRKHPSVTFQKGSNWFSIGNGLAQYIISREKEIESMFRFSLCADELFVQTLVVNSVYRKYLNSNSFLNVQRNSCRYIDWVRGCPYVFGDGDLDELVHADPQYLFARKFDYQKSPTVIHELCDYLLAQ